MTPPRRLRRSSSVAHRVGEPARASRGRVGRRAARGWIGARGVADRRAGDPQRLARGERRRLARGGSGGRRGRRRPPRRRSLDVLDERRCRARRRRRCRGRRAPPGRSRGWWRSSRRRSRRARAASRSRRTRDLARGAPSASSAATRVVLRRAPPGEHAREPRSALTEPLAHALAQLAGRHPREGHEQQLVERHALGDVARGQRGDRVRLAGARARLEHGHAGRQRPADVERAAHVAPPRALSRPVPQPRREQPEARRLGRVPALVGARRRREQRRRRSARRRGRAGARARVLLGEARSDSHFARPRGAGCRRWPPPRRRRRTSGT